MDYFNVRSLFSKNQYGFLPGKGTDLAIGTHVTRIAAAIDKHMYTMAVYLDFRKAFDVLDINILISKFRKYGIGGLALSWLMSFCRGRKQVVNINGCLSNEAQLQYGTAQGGVLGPILFLIFINDLLGLELYSSLFAYADDTAIVCSAYNRQSLMLRIKKDLQKIAEWLIINRLLINSSKSKCILFFDHNKSKDLLRDWYDLRCHNHQCLYSCTCTSIEIVDNVKYLGVYIDDHLKWDHHIHYLTKKLGKVSYALYHMKKFIRSDQLKKVYTSWFESLLRYGIMHYGATYPTIVQPVIMCQRRVLRIMYSLGRYDRVSHLFQQENILTFNQLHYYSTIMHVHKYIYLFNVKHTDNRLRSAQHLLLEIPSFTKELSRHQFCYIGPTLFNAFVKQCGNDVHFEEKVKIKPKAMRFVTEH